MPVILLTSVTKQTAFRFVADNPRHPAFLPVDELIEKPVPLEALLNKVEALRQQRHHM